MITRLEPVAPLVPAGDEGVAADHPMRKVTHQVAFEPDGWTPERAAKVKELFDGLAPEWHARASQFRLDPLIDALHRGGPLPRGTWLELGSGTGNLTPHLVGPAGRLVALDLSYEMVSRAAPDCGLRVVGDGSRLPLGAGVVSVLVLVNAFLFPAEARRVLAPDGVVVWVSSLGTGTPIYLSAEEVADALGPEWSGVASAAGSGTWAVLRRP